MPFYDSVSIIEDFIDIPPVNRRKRRETLVVFLIIFLIIFVFSTLAWYFYTNPNIDPTRCGKRIVGYYRGWGGREVSDGQLRKLTHVIFSSAVLDSQGKVSFGSKSREDAFSDLVENSRKVNPGLKVIVSIGGGSQKSVDLMIESNETHENSTVPQSILSFLERYQADGVELQWKHWPKDETNHQLQILKKIRDALPATYLITLSLSSSEFPTTDYLRLDNLLSLVDFVSLTSFDYSPSSPGPFAPLASNSSQKNLEYTLKSYYCQTKQWEKINMGVAFYGRSWENVLEPVHQMNETSINMNLHGDSVQWRRILRNLKLPAADWDEETKTSFIWNADAKEYISFENEKSLLEKMKYAVENNVGGVAISMLDFDDDRDTLLNTVSSVDMCDEAERKVIYDCRDLFVDI